MASSADPRRLEALAQEAAFKLKRSREYMISASILLAECKWRVDAGDPDAQGASWTDYCRVRFPECSRSQVCTLLRADFQPDHWDDWDEATAVPDAFDRIWSAFIALDRKGQHDLLRCGTVYVARSEDAVRDSTSASQVDLPHVLDQLA